MVWRAADIEIVIDDYQTDDPVVTADVTTPDGVLKVMGTRVESEARTLVFDGVHVESDLTPGHFGGRLWNVLKLCLEIFDVDKIVVRGAVRTTGARPYHRPREIRVTRKV